jgi:hypothetical protein
MPPDLSTIDPATLQPGPETDALVAELLSRETVMLRDGDELMCHYRDDEGYLIPWSPSRNADHAGELRREFADSDIQHFGSSRFVLAIVWDERRKPHEVAVDYAETNGDKAAAEALAVTRAFVAAMIAEKEGTTT